MVLRLLTDTHTLRESCAVEAITMGDQNKSTFKVNLWVRERERELSEALLEQMESLYRCWVIKCIRSVARLGAPPLARTAPSGDGASQNIYETLRIYKPEHSTIHSLVLKWSLEKREMHSFTYTAMPL